MEQVLIRFRLTGEEARALQELSAGKLRHPRDQVRYLLRCVLRQKGYIKRDASFIVSQEELSAQALQSTPVTPKEAADVNNQ